MPYSLEPTRTLLSVALIALPLLSAAQTKGADPFDDHASLMKQLGIKSLRPGPNPNDPATYDEVKANRYATTLPDVLKFKSGKPVLTPKEWEVRRKELVEIFEREIYGRIPKRTPSIRWEVTSVTPGMSGKIPTITKQLVGHVDNRSYPAVTVDIQASVTVPAHTKVAVPIILEFGFGFGRVSRPGATAPTNPWTDQAIAHGWGYGTIIPASIQPDNDRLNTGIIGLCNHGQPRKPDQWGALRAWAWGVSRLIDHFEKAPELKIDPAKVGIEGVSRYGKAALVTQAFDPRVAVSFVASSGEGGAKLHRHIFGEGIENLAGGEFYWMAGNIIKYGAADPLLTQADLPVDSHELLALCAPRPCFLSYGTIEHGDPNWVDARGSYMSGILASPVYELLGKQGLGVKESYLTAALPPVEQLVGGELAWRQHNGGHEATPNWPAFFDWVGKYITAPPLPTEGWIVGPRADQPSPRGDANSMKAHAQLVAKAKKGGIDLYLLGDSITRRWGTSDPQYADFLKHFKTSFFGWNAGDFGWGGDTTQNILWRIRNGELDGVNPKVIVLLAGTNNIGGNPTSMPLAREVADGLRAIVADCHARAPKAKILVTGIFPRTDNQTANPTIAEVNRLLGLELTQSFVMFVDVTSPFQKPGLTVDGLHPNVAGYSVWEEAIRPILTKWLGPRAATDHAPAPTGDPSIAPPAQ